MARLVDRSFKHLLRWRSSHGHVRNAGYAVGSVLQCYTSQYRCIAAATTCSRSRSVSPKEMSKIRGHWEAGLHRVRTGGEPTPLALTALPTDTTRLKTSPSGALRLLTSDILTRAVWKPLTIVSRRMLAIGCVSSALEPSTRRLLIVHLWASRVSMHQVHCILHHDSITPLRMRPPQ